MRNYRQLIRFALAIGLSVVLTALIMWEWAQRLPSSENTIIEQGVSLQPPPFIKAAVAAESAQIDFNFILEEAGITAYTNLDQELYLASLLGRFKSRPRETSNFLKGIVVAPGYEELPEFDEKAEVQVLVHKDGWIIAYLTRWQTAAELFDWVNYDGNRLEATLIESVIHSLAADLDITEYNIAYYDFRHPDATNLLLAADRADSITSTDSFEMNVPAQLRVYESSWSGAQNGIFSDAYGQHPGTCALNDDVLATLNPGGERWRVWTGELGKTEFPQGKDHNMSVTTVRMRSYCGIAVVYGGVR